MKKQTKELRVKIDGLAQLTEDLNPVEVTIIGGYKNSKEIEKAYDSLIFAKAWLGKLLGELSIETPYKNDGKRKSVEDIEPAADVNRGVLHEPENSEKPWQEKSHIEKVDWLRQEIQKLILDVENLDSSFSQHQSQGPSREFAIARTNAYNYLCEARIWLGFELVRISKE